MEPSGERAMPRPTRRCPRFLALLGRLLEVEARLKRGAQPCDAFRDGLLG